jgi:NADH-ubiquinone oxidoreductase chain 6
MTTIALDILAISTIVAAIFVITARSPIVAVLFLIAVFVLAACYLISLGITYVGLTYLVVYVGAVAVLFLFVVMMLNVRLSEVVSTGYEYTKGLPLGAIMAVVFLLESLSIVPAISTHAGEIAVDIINKMHSFIFGLSPSSASIANVNLMFPTNAVDASFNYVSQVQSLGISLYTYGSIWLVIISFVLLLSMLGPIALCLRARLLRYNNII